MGVPLTPSICRVLFSLDHHIELLGLAPSTVSKHMNILQQAGLVQRRKDGKWHFYRLAGKHDSPVAPA